MASLMNRALVRQLKSYIGIGLVATGLHYCVLIALVQVLRVPPVTATLFGYLFGGVVSYSLNRRHTFASDRPHDEAVWRFVAVAAVGFGLTYVLMRQFVELWHAPYLPAQIVTTGMVMFWTFAANRLWTVSRRGGRVRHAALPGTPGVGKNTTRVHDLFMAKGGA